MSPATFFSILSWIITGAIAGYLSSLLLKAGRTGCIVKIAIGIAGAFLGSFVMGLLFQGGLTGIGFLDQIIDATVGAILLLIILEIILPGKQLGVSDDEGRRRR